MPSGVNIAVDIGGTHLRAAVVEGARALAIEQRRIDSLVARGGELNVVPALVEMIEKLLADHPSARGRAIGIGIASGVDAAGQLHAPVPHGVPSGSQLRDQIASAFGSSVVIDNDANMAAVGEGEFGAARGTGTFVLITLGTNIGMGIVIDGSVYQGASGAAGELGMVPLPVSAVSRERWVDIASLRREGGSEPRQYVWLEELYGGRALLREYQRRTGAPRASRVASAASVKVLGRAAEGDQEALIAMRDAARGWALAIATVSSILDPALVLLGGGLSEDVKPFLDLIREETLAIVASPPRIDVAVLGPEAGLMGAGVAAAQTDG